MNLRLRRTPAARHQRGIAVILIVLLVGVGLLVTVHGVFRAVQSAQEQTVMMHARTPAEATAWYGAEAVRRYLDKVDQKTLNKWVASPPTATTPIVLELSGTGAVDSANRPNVTAGVIKVAKLVVSASDYNYRATAHVTGVAGDGRVKATAPIEVVYNFQIKPPATSGPTALTGPILSGLRLRGTPTVPTGTNFRVLGNVDIADVALTGLVDTSVNATGNVSITSAALSLKKVHGNGDVTLANGVRADAITSRGNVTISGDGTQGTVKAHGDVTFKWARATTVETQGNLIVGEPYPSSCAPVRNANGTDNTYIGTAYVEKNVRWYSCGAGLESLYAEGDLEYHGAAKRADGTDRQNAQRLRARGRMDLRSAEATGRFLAWGDITWGPTAKVLTNPPTLAHPSVNTWCTKAHLQLTEYNRTLFTGILYGFGSTAAAFDTRNNPHIQAYGATLPASHHTCNATNLNWPPVDVTDVPPYQIEPPKIDANALRTDANYEFAFVQNEFQVTVRNVKDVPSDTYILGWRYADPANTFSEKLSDHLCPMTQLSGNPVSTVSNQRFCNDSSARRICEASSGASCFHYESGTFVVGSYPDAPRDYDNANTAARGIYFFPGNLEVGQKAFVATWIATGNILLGPNHITLAPNLAGFSKTCANETLIDNENNQVPSPSLAGTISTSLCGTTGLTGNKLGNVAMIAGSYAPDGSFVGGNITAVDGKTNIAGLVIAGNKFTSRGSTTITGQVVAAGQAGDTTTPGADIEHTFTLLAPPTGTNDPGCLHSSCKPSTGNDATVVWSRYR